MTTLPLGSRSPGPLASVARGLFLLVAVGGSGTLAADPFTPTNSPRPDFWDTDGVIHAMVATNGVVYVGGDFSYVAPKGTKVAAVDVYTGERLSEFPAIVGAHIYAIVEDLNGGWFIGGEFTRAGGLPRTNLVHVLSDYRVDPNFLPNPNAAVQALALDGNQLLIGGDFTVVGGLERNHIAALDLAAGVVTSWRPEADRQVAVLLIDEDRVFAGGSFLFIGGQARMNLAELDRVSGAATAWSPDCDGDVRALGLRQGWLYVGGFFNRIGGQLRNGLAALSTTTALATPWNPDPDGGKVTALRIVCDSVLVGGYFTHLSGVPRARVAAVNADSGVVTGWDAQVGQTLPCRGASSILGIEVSGQTVYLAGEFDSVGGEVRRDLATVDLGTGHVLPWNPDLNGGASAIAVAGRTVLAGFASTPGGVQRCNLAAFDAITGRVTDWNPGADGVVYALAAAAGRVFVGGGFANVGGLPRNRLAALEMASGAPVSVPGWTNQANDDVLALAISGNTLFAGGRFTLIGDSNRKRLAALDLNTGALLSNWVARIDSGSVYALASADGALYVGGSFPSIGAFARNNLAVLDEATGAVLPWDPGANGRVQTLAVDDGVVYAGGIFDQAGGSARAFLAAIDQVGGQATEWNPGADNPVYALAVSGGTVYVGGIFLSVAGAERLGLAAVGVDGQLRSWNPGASIGNQVFALTATETALSVAGRTGLEFGGSADVFSLGVFPRAGAPVVTRAPRDQRVPVGQSVEFTVAAFGQTPLFYQWQFNGADLPGETNATLRLDAVQVAQSGRYQVLLRNALGAVTAEAILTVLLPPVFVSQPVSQTVPPGVNVILSVSAVGNPPPLYQWRLNGADIAGAVFPTLTLTNVTPASGGSYEAVVFNGVKAVSSAVGTILVASPALPFADLFALAGRIPGASGLGSGSNLTATIEDAEPRHAGKWGGASVWLRWVAPANGIATFDTRGSSFDTLLAVYAGTNLNSLVEVAADDDRGGFLASRVSFNAVADAEYRIAIDGSVGAMGNIVLAWDLDTNASPVPRFIIQPLSLAVRPGENATFFVEVSSPTPPTYQWFKACDQIPGATNATLVVTNVRRQDLGAYRVVVMNASSHVAESFEALLQIGPQTNIVARDKLGDFLPDFTASSLGAPLLLSFGTPFGSQLLNNTGATNSPGEPNHCDVLGGASVLMRVVPTANGTLLVDTIGSTIDTVLAVYRGGEGLTGWYSALVGCDNNSAPDGIRSLVRIPSVNAGVTYLLVVDGVSRAQGFISLNWKFGLPPVVLPPLATPAPVPSGQRAVLRVAITNSFNATYQWLFNGQPIPNATNTILTVSNVSLANAGSYTTIISNFAGVVTNTQLLFVELPYLRAELRFNGQTCRLWLPAVTNQVVLEASTGLPPTDWLPLYWHPAREPAEYWDVATTNNPYHFFRIRPWP